jgi:hypothetical protein
MKEELSKDMEKPRKRESNRNPGNGKFLKSNEKYSQKPILQTRSRKQHFYHSKKK